MRRGVTICPLTTHLLEAPLTRIPVEPMTATGTTLPSQIMVDKITTIPRENTRDRLGRLPDADLFRLDRAILVFLGLAR